MSYSKASSIIQNFPPGLPLGTKTIIGAGANHLVIELIPHNITPLARQRGLSRKVIRLPRNRNRSFAIEELSGINLTVKLYNKCYPESDSQLISYCCTITDSTANKVNQIRTYYIQMKYVEGKTLKDSKYQSYFTLFQDMLVIVKEYIKLNIDQQIIHIDGKADNLKLFTTNNEIRKCQLLDFEESGQVGDLRRRFPATERNTSMHVAPECFRKKTKTSLHAEEDDFFWLTPAIDVYSVCDMLNRLRLKFFSDSYPKKLLELIKLGLSEDPDRRPQLTEIKQVLDTYTQLFKYFNPSDDLIKRIFSNFDFAERLRNLVELYNDDKNPTQLISQENQAFLFKLASFKDFTLLTQKQILVIFDNQYLLDVLNVCVNHMTDDEQNISQFFQPEFLEIFSLFNSKKLTFNDDALTLILTIGPNDFLNAIIKFPHLLTFFAKFNFKQDQIFTDLHQKYVNRRGKHYVSLFRHNYTQCLQESPEFQSDGERIRALLKHSLSLNASGRVVNVLSLDLGLAPRP